MKALSSRVTRLERSAPKCSPVVILDAYDMEPSALDAEIKRLEGTGTTIIIDNIPRHSDSYKTTIQRVSGESWN